MSHSNKGGVLRALTLYLQPETLSTVKKCETSYGTPPIPPNNTAQTTPSLSHSSSSSSYRSVADASSIRIERMVRSSSNANNGYYNNKSNNSSRASLHADRDGLLDTAEDGSLGMGPGIGIGSQDGAELDAGEGEEEEVLHINLSSAMMNPRSLPESVKLQSHGTISRNLLSCNICKFRLLSLLSFPFLHWLQMGSSHVRPRDKANNTERERKG